MNIKKKDIISHKLLFFGIIITVVVHFIAVKFFIVPTEENLKGVKLKLEKLTKEENNLSNELKTLSKAEDLINEKQTRLTEFFLLKSKLIDFTTTPTFLKKIVDYRAIKIESLKPDKKISLGQFQKLPITITMSGSYVEIGNYLKYLDNLPYIISVKKVSLSKSDAKGVVKATLFLEVVGR